MENHKIKRSKSLSNLSEMKKKTKSRQIRTKNNSNINYKSTYPKNIKTKIKNYKKIRRSKSNSSFNRRKTMKRRASNSVLLYDLKSENLKRKCTVNCIKKCNSELSNLNTNDRINPSNLNNHMNIDLPTKYKIDMIENPQDMNHKQAEISLDDITKEKILEIIPQNAIARQKKASSKNVSIFNFPGGKTKIAAFPNGTSVIIWSEVFFAKYNKHFAFVEPLNNDGSLSGIKGWGKSQNFINKTFNIILTIKLSDDCAQKHKQLIDVSKGYTSKVYKAFQEKKTYTHLSLVYDNKITGPNKISDLIKLITTLDNFAKNNSSVNINLNKIGITKTRISLDANTEDIDYHKATALLNKLVNNLKTNENLKNLRTPREWHATIFLGETQGNTLGDRIKTKFQELGDLNCPFDNITIMTKVGNLKPYEAIAIPTITFYFNN